MSILFELSDNEIRAIEAKTFGRDHLEEDLQRWADSNPHLLNLGQPMLSLGCEIVTRRGRYIDNLFLDRNGCLVVAELKRGKAVLDVTGQALDYAAFASGLSWPDLEALCEKRHGVGLAKMSRQRLGFEVPQSETPKHRILIVAERFDPNVEDTAAYLINMSVDLCLLGFDYYETGETKLLDVRVVLGEIPDQRTRVSSGHSVPERPEDGYLNWLGRTIRTELPSYAAEHGLEIEIEGSGRYFNFVPKPWPHPIKDCRFSIGVNRHSVGLYFSYVRKRVPDEYDDLTHEIASKTDNPYDPGRLKVNEVWTTLSHTLDQPTIGATQDIRGILEAALTMTAAIGPAIQGATAAPQKYD